MKLLQIKKKNNISLKWQEKPEGIEFYFFQLSRKIPLNQIDSLVLSYETKVQWLLLKELIDNGEAELKNESIFVPNDTIFILSQEDIRLLELPEFFPYDIKIDSKDKTLNQPDFTYYVSFIDHNEQEFFAEPVGCILSISTNRKYLLTKEQFLLLNAIYEFNNLPSEEKQFRNNLIRFSEIKTLSKQAGVILDRYLNNENVITPKKICLRLNRKGNFLEILPELQELNELNNDVFIEKFKNYPKIQEQYTIQDDDTSRIRIVFNEKQVEALKTVKSKGRVDRNEAIKLAECPQEVFDPDVIELDPSNNKRSFSERVKEIGFYKPKVYPFVLPYKSQWIPGFIKEDPEGNIKRILISSKDELEKFKKLLEQAKNSNKNSFTWKGEELDVNDPAISKIVKVANEQIKNPNEPVTSVSSTGDNREPVLIIKENIEALEIDKALNRHEISYFYEPPPNLRSGIEIFEHQKKGIAWLQSLYKERLSGCLLADDMGLGKTLQVLSFIDWHSHYITKKQPYKKPYLIISPVTLLENWEAEFNKFFYSRMKILTLYGNNLKYYRKPYVNKMIPDINGKELIPLVRKRRGYLDIKKIERADIVLTTYETVRDFQIDLGQIDWAVVVIDEAQKIKTPGTLVTNAVKALKAEFKIACTGTPVENSLVDLWCITDFVAPGLLGSASEFAKKYQYPLKNKNENPKKIGEEIRREIGIYLTRRIKKDILSGLPEKYQHVEKAQMPEIQLKRYVEAINSIHEHQFPEIKKQRNYMLQLLHHLKIISAHPFLTNCYSEKNIERFINQSAKLMKTIEILQDIKSRNEKVVIFSESRKVCRMLKQVICTIFALNPNRVFIVNGDMPGNKQRENSMKVSRQRAIDLFEEVDGFNVLIMSPLAAGVGINITKANHVIHYTRWWNPAKEDQATDRVYRIGQVLPVHVYYPISETSDFKTFDVVLHELLEWKRSIMADTLFPTEQSEITPDEFIQRLFDSENTKQIDNNLKLPINITDIHQMEALDFEAFIACIFKKQGHEVLLTPSHNDKGVDVVVMPKDKSSKGLLIQVKHSSSKRKIGSEPVKEVFTAKRYFEKSFNVKFDCAAVTNSEFTKDAIDLGKINNVKLIDEKWIKKTLKNTKIYWSEVDNMFFNRVENAKVTICVDK